MSQENVEIMRRGLEAFSRHDVATLAAISSPDVELVTLRAALEGTSYRGPNAWTEAFRDFDESWEDLDADVEEIRDDRDWVLVFARLRGRGRGSGVDVDVRLATFSRFRDGLMTSFRVYTDRAEALEAAGRSE